MAPPRRAGAERVNPNPNSNPNPNPNPNPNQELSECCRTGCMYDNSLVWAADECNPSPARVQRRQLDAEVVANVRVRVSASVRCWVGATNPNPNPNQDAAVDANVDGSSRRQLALEPTALGCNPNSVTPS